MFRRAFLVLCLVVFCVGLGCEGTKKPENPNNLPYGTDGPPKREDLKGGGMEKPKSK